MKKAFSLIELVFSIVIIGFCIAAIPRVLNMAVLADATSIKQEQTNALKYFYGILSAYPYDMSNTGNYCKDDYRKNSWYSQFCATESLANLDTTTAALTSASASVSTTTPSTRAKTTQLKDILKDVSELNITNRLGNMNHQSLNGGNKLYLDTKINTDTSFKTLSTSSISINLKDIYTGSNINTGSYNPQDYSDLTKLSNFKIACEDNYFNGFKAETTMLAKNEGINSSYASQAIDTEGFLQRSMVLCRVAVFRGEELITSFYTSFPLYGRVESAFSPYLLKVPSGASISNEDIMKKLKNISGLSKTTAKTVNGISDYEDYN